LTWNVEPPSPGLYGLNWSETTLSDGSVTFLGAVIKKIDGRIDLSVFDKAVEWPFKVIRYPHYDSNVPYHQPAGVFQGQLVRFRRICNSIKNFKHATTQLVIRLLGRGHHPSALSKGWNAHLQKFNSDRITNYSRLRSWFRRMLKWAIKTTLSDMHTNLLSHNYKLQQVWVKKQKDPIEEKTQGHILEHASTVGSNSAPQIKNNFQPNVSFLKTNKNIQILGSCQQTVAKTVAKTARKTKTILRTVFESFLCKNKHNAKRCEERNFLYLEKGC
jgi:hypothetical protein